MFLQEDFDTFNIDGLEGRMKAIQTRIQPKFQQLGEELSASLSIMCGRPVYLHIAKHARRTINPPKDTWLALCDNKRGYKAHPHFQLGLFDDHIFIWLALIYELPGKHLVANALLKQVTELQKQIPDSFVISMDHMKKDCLHVQDLDQSDWETILTRLRDVKKSELLVGIHLLPGDDALQSAEALIAKAEQTYTQLLPLYSLACEKTRMGSI